MIVSEVFFVVLIPFAAAAATAIAARRMRVAPPVVWASGVGLGYLTGQLSLECRRGGAAQAFSALVRPHEAVDWLPLAVLLALGVTVLSAYAPRTWRRCPFVLAGLLAIGLPLRLLAGSVYVTIQWSASEKFAHFALLAATFALCWLLFSSARDDEQPRLRPALLITVAAGAALVIALSGVFVYGELCGAVAAALAGTCLALWLVPGLSGAAGVVTFSLGSLIVLGYFYAQLTPTNAALLFLALIFSGGRLPHLMPSQPPWQRAVLRAALCLVPLALAVAKSAAAAQASMSANPYVA
jgi:hypothetical protein